MPALLDVQDLSANYGRVAALRGVSLTIAAGECVGVLGPNGAGKSTLLRAIMGLLPRGGQVRLDGVGVDTMSTEKLAASGLIMVPETRGIFAPLSVRQNLDLGGWLAGGRVELAQRREAACAVFPRLRERLSQQAGSLSGGEQQMLAIARALMARPRVLLLDEPSLGLAPRASAEILAAIGGLNRGGLSVLLVEQKAPLALQLVTRVYMLSLGRVVAEEAAARIGSHRDLARFYLS